ncbi:hypothetical protein ACFV6M_15990, partial [Streptomyces californicus]
MPRPTALPTPDKDTFRLRALPPRAPSAGGGAPVAPRSRSAARSRLRRRQRSRRRVAAFAVLTLAVLAGAALLVARPGA